MKELKEWNRKEEVQIKLTMWMESNMTFTIFIRSGQPAPKRRMTMMPPAYIQ